MNKLLDPRILSDLLAEAGVSRPKTNSKSYILACPRCTKEGKLYLRKSDGKFVCWYCKERSNFYGAPEYLFAELLGKQVTEICRILYGNDLVSGNLLLDVSFKDFFDDTVTEDDLPTSAQPLQEVVDNPDFRDLSDVWSAPGVAYLESRGVPFDIANQYGIKYWPAKSRIVFPVISDGKLFGWQSRTIKPDKWVDDETGDILSIPKALTYEGLAKDRIVMFADRIKGSKHAILTEGPFDGIKAHLCGGNVVTMGKAVSAAQLNLIVLSGVSEIYLGLDPDASAEMAKLVDRFTRLYDGLKIFDMRPSGKDLGSMSFEEVYDLKMSCPQINRANLFLYLKEY